MPTRITDTSATIIDHIYYYKGRGKHPGAAGDLKMISGNLLCDLSDHLPNFTILMKNKTSKVNQMYVYFHRTINCILIMPLKIRTGVVSTVKLM